LGNRWSGLGDTASGVEATIGGGKFNSADGASSTVGSGYRPGKTVIQQDPYIVGLIVPEMTYPEEYVIRKVYDKGSIVSNCRLISVSGTQDGIEHLRQFTYRPGGPIREHFQDCGGN
jgi:hypothetical protein